MAHVGENACHRTLSVHPYTKFEVHYFVNSHYEDMSYFRARR